MSNRSDTSPTRPSTGQSADQILGNPPASNARVGVFDIDGILRGKLMSASKFRSALDKGFGFCDVVLGWDSSDELYDNATFTGWHTAYPDAHVRLLPETHRTSPMEGNLPLVLGEFSGAAEAICPRGLLRRVLGRAAEMGYRLKAGCEFEFFLFEETPNSIRDKGYRDLRPATPGMFGYSVLRSAVASELHLDLLELCRAMDFELEGLHTETGPGVLEAAIGVDDALAAADKAALFKTYCKIWAQRHGLMATFMARWSNDYPGQSGHIHLSLTDANGSPLFHDASKTEGMSALQRQFVAGQQALMPEFLALVAPTVNSYRRLVPGLWAPTSATWGVDNRTCALRVIPGGADSQRVEYRIAAADMNPYLALAASIASGLHGIERQLEPDAAIEGNAYERKLPRARQLPASLREASVRLRRSTPADDWFGSEFVEHYAATRDWECRAFEQAVTDWELARYFELG